MVLISASFQLYIYSHKANTSDITNLRIIVSGCSYDDIFSFFFLLEIAITSLPSFVG